LLGLVGGFVLEEDFGGAGGVFCGISNEVAFAGIEDTLTCPDFDVLERYLVAVAASAAYPV
jgi:hypothetical protein